MLLTVAEIAYFGSMHIMMGRW